MIARSSKLFLIGFIISLLTMLLLYLLLPSIDYLGGSWTMYGPRETTPHNLERFKESFTNIDLLVKLGMYVLSCWLVFAIGYLVIERWRRLNNRYGNVHFGLSMLGFLLLIALNEHVHAKANTSSFYLSDVYITGNVSAEQLIELNKKVIVYESLMHRSSVLGLLLMFSGLIVFIISVLRAPKL